MPPLALIPGRPTGSPDIRSYGYGEGMTPRASGGDRRPIVNGRELSDADLSNISAYFGRIGDEDTRRYDQGYGLQRDQFSASEKERRARIKLAQQQLDQSRQQFEQEFGLTREKFGEDRRRYDQDFGEGRRRFDLGYGLERDQFGADVLFKGAGMRGPLSWIQGDMYAQGVSQGGLSPYLQALRSGTAVPYGGGTAVQGNPTPLTVGSLAAAMSGQPNGGAAPVLAPAAPGAAPVVSSAARPAVDAYGRPLLSPEAQAAVDATAGVYQRGIANTPLGFLENQTKDQADAFDSQSDYLGRNVRAEREYYRRSRPGQGSALSA